MMSEEKGEGRSIEDLKAVMEKAGKQGVKLVVIGGYAVAVYTRGYRYTKDIDLVTDKPELGTLKGLLKSLDYAIRDTDFGIFQGFSLGSYGFTPNAPGYMDRIHYTRGIWNSAERVPATKPDNRHRVQQRSRHSLRSVSSVIVPTQTTSQVNTQALSRRHRIRLRLAAPRSKYNTR